MNIISEKTDLAGHRKQFVCTDWSIYFLCNCPLTPHAAERSPEDNDKYLDYMYECEEVGLTHGQLISLNDQYFLGLYLCAK